MSLSPLIISHALAIRPEFIDIFLSLWLTRETNIWEPNLVTNNKVWPILIPGGLQGAEVNFSSVMGTKVFIASFVFFSKLEGTALDCLFFTE